MSHKDKEHILGAPHAFVVLNSSCFKFPSDLANIYEAIVRTAIHTVKPENVATFPGRKLNVNVKCEMGNDFSTRIQGTRILARLRYHGLIKKIAKTRKYYFTKLGRQVIATGLKIREFVIIPELCYAQ